MNQFATPNVPHGESKFPTPQTVEMNGPVEISYEEWSKALSDQKNVSPPKGKKPMSINTQPFKQTDTISQPSVGFPSTQVPST